MPDSASERPEDARFISGVILVSRHAERMAQFYRDVLGVPLAEERRGETRPHWGCELGDVHPARELSLLVVNEIATSRPIFIQAGVASNRGHV